MLPCAGQGALGLEVRADATALLERLAGLVHRPTLLAVQAERAVSRALGGSCSMPLAAHAVWLSGPNGDQLELRAVLGHGLEPLAPLLKVAVRRPVATDAAARAMGEQAAAALHAQGAAPYLSALQTGSV
jgi:hydroxymethylbilane synthase